MATRKTKVVNEHVGETKLNILYFVLRFDQAYICDGFHSKAHLGIWCQKEGKNETKCRNYPTYITKDSYDTINGPGAHDLRVG